MHRGSDIGELTAPLVVDVRMSIAASLGDEIFSTGLGQAQGLFADETTSVLLASETPARLVATSAKTLSGSISAWRLR